MNRPSALFACCVVALAAGALALRLPQLDRRPMHGDEANQAVKAGMLWQSGLCLYDPEEHHGPSLYWLTLPSLWLSGANDFAASTESAYRIVPVVFGVGLILLLPLVGDGLGRGAVVLAALFTAVSPAMVYYSRYYVQEMLLVCFTFAVIAFGWRYVRTRSLGWAVAAGASLGLMHATKETWILAAAAMGAALGLTLAWTLWAAGTKRSGVSETIAAIRACLRPGALVAGAAAAVVVAAALYSSFGQHWRGPLDSVLAFGTYLRRGSDPGIHAHPWDYYLRLLLANRPARGFFWSEGLIVGLALVGLAAAVARGVRVGWHWRLASATGEHGEDARGTTGSGLCLFLGLYTLVLMALYSAVPYKTPWCMLSFLHGMILLAGVGACAILRWCPGIWGKAAALVLLGAGTAHLGWQCYWLNFRLAADQRNPYVYAHSSSDVRNLAERMEGLARVSREGHQMIVHVVTPDNYWPLPWYLRRFHQDRVGYWQDAAAWSAAAPRSPPPSVIIFTEDVRPAVDAGLRAEYNRQMMYGLRPGVLLSVYVRDDLWQAMLAAAAAPR